MNTLMITVSKNPKNLNPLTIEEFWDDPYLNGLCQYYEDDEVEEQEVLDELRLYGFHLTEYKKTETEIIYKWEISAEEREAYLRNKYEEFLKQKDLSFEDYKDLYKPYHLCMKLNDKMGPYIYDRNSFCRTLDDFIREFSGTFYVTNRCLRMHK